MFRDFARRCLSNNVIYHVESNGIPEDGGEYIQNIYKISNLVVHQSTCRFHSNILIHAQNTLQ